MALPALKWTSFQTRVCSLLVLQCLHRATGMSGWGACLDGQDVFATVRENSLPGEIVAELNSDTTMEGVLWTLDGKDAEWFSLDERHIRLNATADKALDREAQGPVLMAELLCYEEDTLQSVYRVVVEILNENDNSPAFAENTIKSLTISELTLVNTVVFTVQATDADNDKIIYTIDKTSPDAEYFKFELPNSGEVILSKPLDYETKTQLTVTIHASEMNTAEHFNASTTITIDILDGDDQYPQFLPCVLLFQDETSRICTSPMYTSNVTEGEEDIVLDFSPGPIYAVDGDRGLSTPLSYAILSGDNDSRFTMDRGTGVIKLIQGVRDRRTTPALNLQMMAYQDNDPRKYSVASVLVRILAVNNFHPEFEAAEYNGFATAGKSPASLVNTYGGKVLMLRVQDQDFENGVNPMISFSFSPTSNYTDIYQLTQEGLLIARNKLLKPRQKHIIKVKALDQESGEATFSTLVIEVLSEGQSIPYSPLGDNLTSCTVGKAVFLSMVFMTVLGCILYMMMWLKKIRKGKRDPLERGCVAQGKHPNVSLRWFQHASHGGPMPHTEEASFNEEYGTCNPSFSFSDNPGIYTHHALPSCRGPVPPQRTAAPDTSIIPTETVCSPVIFNNNVFAMTKSSPSTANLHSAPADVNPTNMDQIADISHDKADSPPVPPPEPHKTEPNASQSPTTPFTCPDSQTMQNTNNDDPVDPEASPSSKSTAPCSHTRIASAEIDKLFRKARVKTPPYSPLLSSPLHKHASTPPSTPEQGPLKAKLVHIDTSPLDTPPVTPEGTSVTLSKEVHLPFTSLDQINQSEHPGVDVAGPSQDTRPSVNSENTQDDREVGGEDKNGVLGDKDVSRKCGGESDLDSDEEELLKLMARCNPIFITFNK